MMINEIKEKIANDREILNVLPQNNTRNINKYIEKVRALKKEYTGLVDQVYNFISVKNTLISSNKVDVRIEELNKEIEILKSKLNYFNKYLDSYELLGLDRLYYELHKYYDNDLDAYNHNLALIIDIFNKVNITLTSEDFIFGDNAKLYMDVFFKERNNGNYNSDLVKKKFADLYILNHNMMRFILLNFRYLYYTNIKKFEEYINMQKNNILKEYGSYQSILDLYHNKIKERDHLILNSKAIYIDKFINKELNTNDFTEEKMANIKTEFFGNSECDYNLMNNLYHSLLEYKSIGELRYLFDDIENLKKDNDSYKNIIKNSFKEIDKKQSVLKKKTGNGFLGKLFHKEVSNEEINSLLEELDNDYENLLKNKYKEDVYNLSVDATLQDYLLLACSIHYIIDAIERSQVEIDYMDVIENIKDLIYSPYNTILNNVTYKDIDRINYIIYDKYKLLGINLVLESLDISNLDIIISTVNNLLTGSHLNDIKFDVDEVEFLILSNDIIKNRNN